MFEKAKTFVKENPEQAKKAGIIVGAVLGASAVGVILYLNRDHLELPFTSIDVSELEVPTAE